MKNILAIKIIAIIVSVLAVIGISVGTVIVVNNITQPDMIEIKEKLDLSVKYAGRVKHNKEIFEKYKDKFDNISEFIYYYKNPILAEKERYCKVCGKKE